MERALPTWADNFSGDSGDVQLIFDILVDPNLNTKRRKLFREGMALKNHLDGGAPAGLDGYQYVWAGYAIALGAMAVAQDEYLDLERQGGTQIDLEDPETHHSYDAAAFGAAAHAGDFPWGNRERFRSSLCLEYWVWYLDVVRTEAKTSLGTDGQ